MSTETKYLIYKGIEKKEQILFKSFLNLSKNELTYQVEILKGDKIKEHAPDMVIRDVSYQFNDSEAKLAELPTIRIGNDIEESAPDYLSRPVQWSDFKIALTRLDRSAAGEEVEDEERVLPDEMEFVIAEMDDRSESFSEPDSEAELDGAGDYNFELDNMSVDYHSFTNSDYMKVVDEVKGFKEGEAPKPEPKVVLMTDDESGSSNSVLVIETNSMDAWEMSESEFEDEGIPGAMGASEEADVDERAEKELTEKLESSTPINPGDEYWKYDLEVFSGRESLFFIKPEREMVYSASEPAKWPMALSGDEVTKVPIDNAWLPTEGLRAYPMNRLMWATALAHRNAALVEGLNETSDYVLERWPAFELLELDNVLLKLCTLLFVEPQSAYSLMQKSGCGRNVVFGLLNACQELGILRESNEIEIEKFSQAGNEESVFGKIKDVFR